MAMRQSGKPLRLPVAPGTKNSPSSAAIADAVRKAKKDLADERDSGAAVRETAMARYLRESSLSKPTSDLADAAKQRLRDAMADAVESGGTADDIVAAIKKAVPAFADARAEMIAQTEVNDAYNAGCMAMAHEMGMQEKSWSADGTDACDQCQAQIAAGWILIDEPFPGGVLAPCLHDGCDCGVSFRQTIRAGSVFNTNEVKINEVKSMIREGREQEAEPVLLGLVAAIEEQAQTHRGKLAPWYYERLAIIYRRRRDYASEIAILTRYCQHEGNKYSIPEGIRKRLDTARGLLARANGPATTGLNRI
jgi:hypothetical protein